MPKLPLPNPIVFEKGGPFYEMVGAWTVATVGLESLFRKDNPMGFHANRIVTLEGKVHDEIHLDQFAVYQQLHSGHLTDVHINNSLVGMLVNTAYESVKHKRDNSPQFEFFRHVRNAVSHRNTFNFLSYEPSRPASWRGKIIDDTSKGTVNALYGQQCFGPFLASADALLLLWDIEQKIR